MNRSAAPEASKIDAGGATAERATPSTDADGASSDPLAEGVVDAEVTAAALDALEAEEPEASTTTTTHVHRKSTAKASTTTTTAKPKAKTAATTGTKESTAKAATTTTTTAPKAKATTTTTLASGAREQTGLASWFEEATPGTCAHRSLPKGTKVWVEAVATGKEITCTVNDRGPYIDGRIIDLNHEDFHRLAGPGEGLVEVRISW